MALELKAELGNNVAAELNPDAHELALLRSECLEKAPAASVSASCTHHVAGLALDKIESGWLRHTHLSMPPPMCNLNVHAMLADPLSQTELVHHDQFTLLRLVSTTLVTAEMQLCKWPLHVQNPLDPPYDVQCNNAGLPTLCQVCGCAHGACSACLCASTVDICAEHL